MFGDESRTCTSDCSGWQVEQWGDQIFVVFEKRQKIDEMLMVAYAMMQMMRN